ncbi:caspase family protein [Magnetovibrio sp. PR-2]|uniref:caspase family protein n=1 Tax=Magnetovibrio sp. PR-2 TaxID=3120356 RepID=UPI002FCE3C41
MMRIGVILLVGLLAFPIAVQARSRGLSVELRTSETANAPLAKTVKLYQRSYALVIGNDDYTNGWPRLSNAVKDAQDVAEALGNMGFDVTLKTDLNSRQLVTVLEDFIYSKGADKEARLFLWYAGHGHTLNGEGYLVPTDAPRPKAGAKFKRKALSIRRFGEYMRDAESKHVFTIFDSCFAGTVFDSARAMPPEAITRATTFPVRQFLTSGDADQEVSDNGDFAELFIRAVKGDERADANGDGYVTASELGLFLTDRVTNLTRSRQTPKYGKLLDKDYDRGDFVFRLASASPSAPKVSLPSSPTGGGVNFDDLEQQADKLEESKREWSAWQKKMNKDYDKVIAYLDRDVPFDLKKAALERFVKGYDTDNPYSDQDDIIRSKLKHQLSQIYQNNKFVNADSTPKKMGDKRCYDVVEVAEINGKEIRQESTFCQQPDGSMVKVKNIK